MNQTCLRLKSWSHHCALENNQGYPCRGIQVRKMGLLHAGTGLDNLLHEVYPKTNNMLDTEPY